MKTVSSHDAAEWLQHLLEKYQKSREKSEKSLIEAQDKYYGSFYYRYFARFLGLKYPLWASYRDKSNIAYCDEKIKMCLGVIGEIEYYQNTQEKQTYSFKDYDADNFFLWYFKGIKNAL